MGKGIVELMIGAAVFLIFYIFVITTMIGNSTVLKRNVGENNILLSGSKVETYVRSFMQAMRLSLLQATYDAGNSYADKNWQCYSSNCLSGSCGIDSIKKDILEGDSGLGLNGSTGHANLYLNAYKRFAADNEPKMIVPTDDKGSGSIGTPLMLSADNNFLYARWSDTSFKYCDKKTSDGKDCASDSRTSIDRKFSPEANISTVFRQMYDAGQNFILQDRLWKDAIKPAIQDANPSVSCSSDSCTSSASLTRCGSQPTAEEVYKSKSGGVSMKNTEYYIRAGIGDNLDSLQNTLPKASIYNVEFLDTMAESQVSASCTYSSGDCCQNCGPDSNGPTRYFFTTSCDFNYYGAASTQVNIVEAAYPKYALYNPSFDSTDKVGLDNIRLNYVATSGNKPALIKCSVLGGSSTGCGGDLQSGKETDGSYALEFEFSQPSGMSNTKLYTDYKSWNCMDTADNDKDCKTDCADPDCSDALVCAG